MVLLLRTVLGTMWNDVYGSSFAEGLSCFSSGSLNEAPYCSP